MELRPKKKAVSISINYSWPPGWQSIGASIACQLNRPILAKTLLGWFGFFIWTQIIGLEMEEGTTRLAAIASLMGILTSLYNKVYRAITGLTASQKQFLVKCRSLINDHMWIVTGEELRNVNTSSPNRLQRNRTEKGSPNKPTRLTLWLSQTARFLKMHQSCRDIWLRLMDLKLAQWGDRLECADSTSVLCSLEWVWIVPLRDPLIKGFGRTQK